MRVTREDEDTYLKARMRDPFIGYDLEILDMTSKYQNGTLRSESRTLRKRL